jgi:hypothetical protein
VLPLNGLNLLANNDCWPLFGKMSHVSQNYRLPQDKISFTSQFPPNIPKTLLQCAKFVSRNRDIGHTMLMLSYFYIFTIKFSKPHKQINVFC